MDWLVANNVYGFKPAYEPNVTWHMPLPRPYGRSSVTFSSFVQSVLLKGNNFANRVDLYLNLLCLLKIKDIKLIKNEVLGKPLLLKLSEPVYLDNSIIHSGKKWANAVYTYSMYH